MRRYGFLDINTAVSRLCCARPNCLSVRPEVIARFSSSSATTTAHNSPPHRRRRHGGRIIVGLSALSLTAGIVFYTTANLSSFFSATTKPALNPQTFTPFTLIAKEPVGDGSSAVFTFEGTGGDIWGEGGEGIGKIYSVQIAMEEMQVWRKYTPLPPPPTPSSSPDGKGTHPNNNNNTNTIRLLIRNSTPTGLVSPHVHALPLGARVLIRGPFVEYEIPQGAEEVVCLVGGTGVAVALQVVQGVLEGRGGIGGEGRRPRVRVVWGCRRGDGEVGGGGQQRWYRRWRFLDAPSGPNGDPPGSPILRTLHSLQAQHPTLSVSQHVDDTTSSLRPQPLLSLLTQKNSNTAKKLLLISGPPGFLSHWLGPKTWVAGFGEETQGPLEGVLGGEAGRRGWAVWKF